MFAAVAVATPALYAHYFSKKHWWCLGKVVSYNNNIFIDRNEVEQFFELILSTVGILIWLYHFPTAWGASLVESRVLMARMVLVCVGLLLAMSLLWPLEKQVHTN